MSSAKPPEPWLRGTLGEIPTVARAVLHALQSAQDWTSPPGVAALAMRN